MVSTEAFEGAQASNADIDRANARARELTGRASAGDAGSLTAAAFFPQVRDRVSYMMADGSRVYGTVVDASDTNYSTVLPDGLPEAAGIHLMNHELTKVGDGSMAEYLANEAVGAVERAFLTIERRGAQGGYGEGRASIATSMSRCTASRRSRSSLALATRTTCETPLSDRQKSEAASWSFRPSRASRCSSALEVSRSF